MKIVNTRSLWVGVALSALVVGQAGAWTHVVPTGQGSAADVVRISAEDEAQVDLTGGVEVDPAEPEVVIDEVLVDPAPVDDIPVDEVLVDPVPEDDDGVMWIGGSPDFCEACTSTGVEPGTEDEPVMADVVEGEGEGIEVVVDDPVMMEDGGASPEEIRDVISTTGMPTSAPVADAQRSTNGSSGQCGGDPRNMYCPD